MRIEKEEFQVGAKKVISYGCADPKYILLQPVDDHDIEVLDAEAEEIEAGQVSPFIMAAFKIDDWNTELSPWEAPAVFGKENFGAGAKETLAFVEGELLPTVRAKYGLDVDIPVIIGGYSLAGFFALWSAYQHEVFAAVMAASPSVWFEGWMEYAGAHTLKTGNVYLSLGDKEEKTRNQTMARVGDAIREQERLLKEQDVHCSLEWNKGNHFQEPDHRCAKGFIWCMEAMKK